MANNNTLFSSDLEFPEGAKARVETIVESFRANEDEDCSDIDALEIVIEDTGITIYSEGEGTVETAVALAQKILDDLEINSPFILEWAETCDKPRPNEFGGGAVIVRRGKEPIYHSTRNWVEDQLANIA